MALANVAWVLASQGKRVLTLDWDLEAPGLHRYFYPFLLDKDLTSSDGLIDFVIKFAEAATVPESQARDKHQEPAKTARKTTRRRSDSESSGGDEDWYKPYTNILRYASSLSWDFPDGGTIDVIPAGRQGSSYSTRVNSFSWQSFYEKLGGGILLEHAKQRMRAEYDYVLIDSRTGVSDTSGICTVQMPDILVVCFTLNNQSIEGAGAVTESVAAQPRRPNELQMPIFPIPTRVENSEKEKLELAMAAAREKFDRFLWHIEPDKRSSYWGNVAVSYVPFYAYEEILATFGDKPFQTNSILGATERIVTYLTGVETPFEPVSESERQRVLALYSRQKKTRKGAGIRLTSPQFLFYLSYARANLDPLLARFYGDLSNELRRRLGYGSETVGFFDDANMARGDSWPERIGEALQESQVMVSLYSPAYFKSEQCGKEFQIFLERQRTAASVQASGGSRPAILPLLWIPTRESIPAAAADVQYLTGAPTSEYFRKGLRQMVKQYGSFQYEYEMILSEFAETLIKTTEAQVLPPLLELPSLANVNSAFRETDSPISAPSRPLGPRLVSLVYVVPTAVEMQELGTSAENYSDEDAWDWQPFFPDIAERAGVMAQRVAAEEGLFSEIIVCDDVLVSRLREIESRNNLAVLIVDVWAMLIPRYQELLVQLDQQNFLNLAVLVLCNDRDSNLQSAWPTLDQALKLTFRYHMISQSNQLWRLVKSAEEFRQSLHDVLTLTRMRMLELGAIAKPLEAGLAIDKPKLSGPP